jgi:hypothetical protein
VQSSSFYSAVAFCSLTYLCRFCIDTLNQANVVLRKTDFKDALFKSMEDFDAKALQLLLPQLESTFSALAAARAAKALQVPAANHSLIGAPGAVALPPHLGVDSEDDDEKGGESEAARPGGGGAGARHRGASSLIQEPSAKRRSGHVQLQQRSQGTGRRSVSAPAATEYVHVQKNLLLKDIRDHYFFPGWHVVCGTRLGCLVPVSLVDAVAYETQCL